MNRRLLPSAALLAALALAAGCGKKPAPEPEVGPDPKTEQEARAEAVRRLKLIGASVEKFREEYGWYPAGTIARGGKLGLSWRVSLLPYLGEEKLYAQFKLDQPWDSPQNLELLPRMPKVFESPARPAAPGRTHLRAFTGSAYLPADPPQKGMEAGRIFPDARGGEFTPGRLVQEVTDGTADTLLAAEASEPVEWTRPDVLPFFVGPAGAGAPVARALGEVFPGGFHGLMCDGSVHFFPDTLSEKTLRGLISVNGGEVLGKDATDILFPPEPARPGRPNKGRE